MKLGIITLSISFFVLGTFLVIFINTITTEEANKIKLFTDKLDHTKSCFLLSQLDRQAAEKLVYSDYIDFEKQIEKKADEIKCQ